MKDDAKVSFGMANASMKWNDHVTDILKGIQSNVDEVQRNEAAEEIEEHEGESGDEDDNWFIFCLFVFKIESFK